MDAWRNFKGETWKNTIDVRDFIMSNVTPYTGDESFLTESTDKTKKVWSILEEKMKVELDKGIYDVDTKTVSGIDAYEPGYISKDDEVIVGLQTDEALKRICNPWGGIRMVESALQSYGYEIDPEMKKVFTMELKSQ